MTKTRDLADLVNGITSADITDGTLTNTDINASAGIVASKLAFTQAGSGAVQRTVEAKLQDVVSVKDFGAVGDGVADDTAAIQAAVTYCMQNTYGGTVEIPPGRYKVTSTITLDRSTNTSLSRVSIRGADQESSRIYYFGGGTSCFYIAHAQSGGVEPNSSHQTISDLTILGQNSKQAGSSGVTVNLGAFIKLERLYVTGFDYGLYLQDTDHLYAEKLTLRFNNNGLLARKSPSPGAASTQPNNHTYVSCTFANNSNSGGTWSGGSDINFLGGDVEYNGSDVNGFGLKFQNCGYEGGRGANIQGLYIEGNTGMADLVLEATAVEYAPLLSVVHQVSASFKRLSGSTNTTNHILCAFGSPSTVGTQSLLLVGSSFRTYSGYTPNASNKVVAYSITPASSSNFHDIGSFYESSVEKPAFRQSLNKFDVHIVKAAAQTFTSGVEAQWAIDTVVNASSYPLWVPTLSSNTVTIPEAGTYNISISLVLSTTTAGQKQFLVKKNGNLIGIFTSDTALNVFTNSFMARLASDDVLSFHYKQSTGAPQDISGANTFCCLNIAKVF